MVRARQTRSSRSRFIAPAFLALAGLAACKAEPPPENAAEAENLLELTFLCAEATSKEGVDLASLEAAGWEPGASMQGSGQWSQTTFTSLTKAGTDSELTVSENPDGGGGVCAISYTIDGDAFATASYVFDEQLGMATVDGDERYYMLDSDVAVLSPKGRARMDEIRVSVADITDRSFRGAVDQ